MLTTTLCPPPESLKKMLGQKLPDSEQAEIVAHLDQCIGCSRKLEEIASGGERVGELVKNCDRDKPGDTSAYWPALKSIENELKNTPKPLDSLGVTQPEWGKSGPAKSGVAKPLSLDFLDPSERPESIGKLDRFHILNVIGHGGMGVVFRAMDGCLERVVAIKMLDPQYAKNDLAHDRFCREARSAAKIMHENVVTIHHVDENEAKELPYIVMQFVNGQSLQDRLDSRVPLDLYDIVRIGKQSAAGLGAAHAENLIHRDVKPANILLEERTHRVLLTDFGLARMNEDVKLTQTGFVAGTPLFMSPEQARGEPVDYRSDLFSLGSVLYAMCTGNPPFEGSTPFLVLRSVTELNPKPIHQINSNIPDWLVDVIERLLAKDPRKRFQSADEVAEILEQKLASIPRKSLLTTSPTRTNLLPRLRRSAWGRRLAYVGLATFGLSGILLATEAAKLTRLTVLGQRGLASSGMSSMNSNDDIQQTPLASFGDKVGVIWSVAFSPNGNLVALGLEDGTIRLWDPKTNKSMGTIADTIQVGPVWSVAFNRDGTELASCNDDGHITIWRLRDRKTKTFVKVMAGVRCIAFSSDGNRIASGNRDGTVEIHDMKSGVMLSSVMGHSGTVTAIAFSPGEEYLATASVDKTAKIWSVSPDKKTLEVNTLKGHEGSIYAIAFDPDGKTLATAGWDSDIRTWDVGTGKKILEFKAHRGDIWGLGYSPKGQYLLSVGSDRMVRFWDPATGAERSSIRAHNGPIYAVSVAPDGKNLVTASRDGTVQVWNMPK